MPVVIHEDCIVCLAANEPAVSAGDETLALLGLLTSGLQFEQVIGDLCFAHRRRVDDTARAVRRENG